MQPPNVFVESYHATFEQAQAAFREAAASVVSAGLAPGARP
jgi:hypothetical protein